MKTKVLDCTLRDGGYCNGWQFGYENTKKVIKSLSDANVEIVECGFLTNNVQYNKDITKYERLDNVTSLLKDIGLQAHKRQFVVMANLGEYDFNTLPKKNNDVVIDGIRLAFHKRDKKEAERQALIIKQKGYKLYLQPMVTLSYTDVEFLELIAVANRLEPYAFYIVDSFGTMKKKELTRLFYMTDHNLDDGIIIGFHSHNNMQLAYANAQTLMDIHALHDLIIDCSIYGMGRGAGNLNTELFLDYLNDNFGGQYHIKPLIRVIDRVLDTFYKENFWGYSLPNYLSASYSTHPNYAGFFTEKNALNVEDMDAILGMMKDEKRASFDRNYAEEVYSKYLSSGVVYGMHWEEFNNRLKGSTVLLIAPGRSSYEERESIVNFSSGRDICVISINHAYEYRTPDFVFLSNLRRFRDLDKRYYGKSIITSNISTADAYLQTDYGELLNDNEYVRDNAGLMAVHLMVKCGVKEIIMAGFDGYSYDSMENYANKGLMLITKRALVDAMNEGMEEELIKYKECIDIRFLTKPKFVRI